MTRLIFLCSGVIGSGVCLLALMPAIATETLAQKAHRFSLGSVNGSHGFVDPDGNRLWVLGVNHIGDTRPVPKTDEPQGVFDARTQAAENLRKWGYNCAGGDNSGPIQEELPYFVTVSLTNTAHWMPQHRFGFEDVFSEGYEKRIQNSIKKVCDQHCHNRNLIGYFWTDTPRWDLELTRNRRGSDWVSYVRSLPANSPGKKSYVDFLMAYFDHSFDQLNRAFRSKFDSFDQVAESKLAGLELIRPEVRRCDLAFLGVIANRIYSVAATAFQRYDRHALLLGEKYKSHDHPSTVLEAAVKYVDVISIQDGPEFGPFPGQGRHESQFNQAYFDRLFADTGKPILIVDHAISWKTPARPQTLWYQCETQADAARMYDAYLTAAANRPYILGLCRCQYLSEYRADRGLLKQGLLDENGQPYAQILEMITQSNQKALKIRNRTGEHE